MSETWEIAGVSVKPGHKLQEYIPVDGTDEVMPVTFVNGEEEGKTVLITSGIHGGEYEGIHAAIEIAAAMQPQDIKGRVMIIHPVSVSTFRARQENLTPADGKNLNRVFPPDKNGTLTDKIAWTLWDKFMSKADFHIDMHGCFSDWITPHVYYTGVCDCEVCNEAKAAAVLVNVPYMVKSVATTGAYNYGGIQGIPGILIERGHSNLLSDADVRLYKRDVRNVLCHLGLLEGEPEQPIIRPVDVEDLTYVNTNVKEPACWHPKIRISDEFLKGDVIGEVRDFFGNVLETTYAEFDGIALYMMGMMPIEPGGFEICYAKLSR